ncbi:hypothetical protein CY35_02G063900 [Sphagnum magellanicum]|jgi:hypothetical protein|nr:hypothetical protein CY35_02G063900 [Sphagnum magellanicum]
MNLADLPEDCIATIISHTTPIDAARLTRVCSAFKRAIESDAVWENFLPSDYKTTLKTWPSSGSKKKDIVMTMANGVFLDQGLQKYVLLRRTRGVCRVLSVEAMNVAGGQDTRFWRWEQSRSSCFGKIAHLLAVCWLEINGTWSCSLPPGSYTAVWRLRIANPQGGRFHFLSWKLPLTFCISIGDGEAVERQLSLSQVPSGGFQEWFEFEVGEITIKGSTSTVKQVDVMYAVRETDCTYWKGGLFVDCLTLRPSDCKENIQPSLCDLDLSKIRGHPGVF